MRESNFSNPAQNKACVCISASVYDRRAIDCTATLPLINSLNHLAYLTSTSPRIREMVTLDGGLERLIRILRTVPKAPSPHARAITIKEMQAIWKWSLAFQCVVNIGVRGSESVRTRVVEAGMVPVTIRVLESYLRNLEHAREERKREAAENHYKRGERTSRERQQDPASTDRSSARRAMVPSRTREESASSSHTLGSDIVQPNESGANTTSSGPNPSSQYMSNVVHAAQQTLDSASSGRIRHLANETRPTTPLEADPSAAMLVDMQGRSSSDDFMDAQTAEMTVVDSSDRRGPIPIMDSLDSIAIAPAHQVDVQSASLGVGVSSSVSSASSLPPVDTDSALERFNSHAPTSGVLTNVSSSEDLTSHGGEASGSEGPEDTDMFVDEADDSELDATLAPERNSNANSNINPINGSQLESEDAESRRTPRPIRRALAPLSDQVPSLPSSQPLSTPQQPDASATVLSERQNTVRPHQHQLQHGSVTTASASIANGQAAVPPSFSFSDRARGQQQQPPYVILDRLQAETANGAPSQNQRAHDPLHNFNPSSTPTTARHGNQVYPTPSSSSSSFDMIYREEEVLLSLQLLAYLSKYAHVRTLFHSSDLTHISLVGPLDSLNEDLIRSAANSKSWDPSEPPKRNVFSIAEKFTLRSSRSGNSHTLPRLSMEIQYWAGVIMRNACRKDESRGGIRQCANMLCGKWESYPREFAKCRRCRKAKYCSKQCQSKGWQMGHRFWCSARADDGDSKDKEREKVSSATNSHAGQRQAEDRGADPSLSGAPTVNNGFPSLAITEDGNNPPTLTQGLVQPPAHGHLAHQAHLGQPHHHHHHHHHHHVDDDHEDFNQTHQRLVQQPQPSPQPFQHQPIQNSFSNLHDPRHPSLTSESRLLNEEPSSQVHDGIASLHQSMPGSSSHATLSNTLRPRRIAQLPGSHGFPSATTNPHLRDRRVTSLASLDTIDGSDLSDDEIERRLIQTRGMHPAVAAAAAVGVRNEASTVSAPQRTDLAGRPLPPPVIASQDAVEDEAALAGRATPGAMNDPEFGNGDFDQMLGPWDTRQNVSATGILQQRLVEGRADISSPERSSWPDIASSNSGYADRAGGRSDDDEIMAPRARYHAVYGQHSLHPSPLRPMPHHHRLHQQRSISGFASSHVHASPASALASQSSHPSLPAVRTAMASSPLAVAPIRQASLPQSDMVTYFASESMEEVVDSTANHRDANDDSRISSDSQDAQMMVLSDYETQSQPDLTDTSAYNLGNEADISMDA